MKTPILFLLATTSVAVALSSFGSLPEACNRKPPPEPTTHQLTEAVRAPAKKKIEAAKAKAPGIDTAHRDQGYDLGDGTTLVPRKDLGACPIQASAIVPEDPSTGTTKSARLSLANKQKTRVLMMTEVYKPAERTPQEADKTPATASLDAILDTLGPAVTGGSWASPEAMMAKVDDELGKWEAGHDLTLITRVYDEPEVVKPEHFTAGRLVGTLYLFSRKEKKFICAADLDGKSAPKPIQDVELDFLVTPIVMALPHLVKVGPIDTSPRDAGADGGKKKR